VRESGRICHGDGATRERPGARPRMLLRWRAWPPGDGGDDARYCGDGVAERSDLSSLEPADRDDCPPTNVTGSRPFKTSGVIAQVPPHPAVATRPAVCAPANGKVKPLVMPPRMQKVALKGA
jgi:hypothetical protein